MDNFLDDRWNSQIPSVDPMMGLRVGGAPRLIQALKFCAIGRQRSSAIGRDSGDQPFNRHIEPDREAVTVDDGAIFGVDEGAAAGRNDEVTMGELIEKDRSLGSSEIWFAVARKNGRDGLVLSLFDHVVDVNGPPVEASRKGAGHRRLAGTHEAYQIHLVGFHATSRCRVEKKAG